MFIAAVPKIAALVLFIHLFAEALVKLHITIAHVVIVLAILSMAVGNMGALRQTQIKRLLGYSSIAHMGYVITLACGTGKNASAYFYVISYAVTRIAFGAISLLARNGKKIYWISSLQGLNSQYPDFVLCWYQLHFFSWRYPPLVGFYG